MGILTVVFSFVTTMFKSIIKIAGLVIDFLVKHWQATLAVCATILISFLLYKIHSGLLDAAVLKERGAWTELREKEANEFNKKAAAITADAAKAVADLTQAHDAYKATTDGLLTEYQSKLAARKQKLEAVEAEIARLKKEGKPIPKELTDEEQRLRTTYTLSPDSLETINKIVESANGKFREAIVK